MLALPDYHQEFTLQPYDDPDCRPLPASISNRTIVLLLGRQVGIRTIYISPVIKLAQVFSTDAEAFSTAKLLLMQKTPVSLFFVPLLNWWPAIAQNYRSNRERLKALKNDLIRSLPAPTQQSKHTSQTKSFTI